MEYLDFEMPIKELLDQLDKCEIIGKESDVDVSATCKKIEKKLDKARKDIYKNLTPWQRVQLSRHPCRPYTLDYIKALCGDTFMELHGDRNSKKDIIPKHASTEILEWQILKAIEKLYV